MSDASIFSRRLLIVWITAAVVTFACSLYFMGGGEPGDSGTDESGSNTFSRSAIGYAGIVETLQRLGVPVVKSRYDAAGKLSEGSVLVLAEPPFALAALQAMTGLAQAKTVLVILPKWQGKPSKTRAGWVGSVDLAPLPKVQAILGLAVESGTITRKSAIGHWDHNALGQTPSIVSPVQLMRSDRLRPIVAAGDDILLGEISTKKRQRVWVLSDPDILENHGLGSAGNAAFALALVNALRSGDGRVVFDETIHGFVAQPASPVKLLFRYPFVFATLQAALAIALLLWATIARFGAPETVPPALDAGKLRLIQNAAKLLEFAGHQQIILRRYVRAALRDVARQCHAPRGLSDDALLGWLERVGQARAVAIDCAALSRRAEEMASGRRIDPSVLIPIARDIHRWKQEIIHGPLGNSRDH